MTVLHPGEEDLHDPGGWHRFLKPDPFAPITEFDWFARCLDHVNEHERQPDYERPARWRRP
jgi:hypothetical protein